MSVNEPLLEVENLHVYFQTETGEDVTRQRPART